MPNHNQQSPPTSSAPARSSAVPTGFTFLRGPDDRKYLVPDFYVGETMFAWDHDEQMELLEVDSASRVPKKTSSEPLFFLGEAELPVPSNPPPTDREALMLHAEVLALQSQWAISYEDAAHRLYLAEVRKLKALKDAEDGFRAVRERVDKTVALEILPALEKVDGGFSGKDGEHGKSD